MRPVHVTTRTLDRREMDALLARHHVGRLAASFEDRHSLTLVNYTYANDWVYIRIESGERRTTIEHHPWVAFEVDEIDGIYDWRTVTVYGPVQFLTDDTHSSAWRDFNTAVQLIRSVVPGARTSEDPMPDRVHLFRIYVDTITGSEARSDARDVLPAP
jgi:nitroimidazol reductase NimA-like FMN-containing flavoprotein (pyridoxamine 5'-phosphate oxidase superfamily)